jgi:hypothetical protein
VAACSQIIRTNLRIRIIELVYSRFSAVSAPPFIRFYIGVALVDRAGYGLGTLCIADTIIHQEAPDLTTLKQLAREAERIITNW